MKRKQQLLAAVLCGVAAAVWTIGTILAVCFGVGGVSAALLVLCAVVWIAAFLVNLHRYKNDKA